MQPAQNLLFSLLACLLLSCPLAYRLVGESPYFFSMPSDSRLEARSLTTLEDMENTSFLDKSFQGQAEQFAADSVPRRDSIMMLNAQMQRLGISLSRLPFGFDFYHTYYGSDMTASNEAHMILPMPAEIPSSQISQTRLDAWIKTINDAADSHPEINFVSVQVTEPSQTSANPLATLTRSYEKVNEAWIEENITSRFSRSITAFCASTEDFAELQTQWFAGDVHWTIQKASRVYNRIASLLGLEPFEYDVQKAICITPAWYGSTARSSRDFDFPSELWDMPYEYPDLTYFRINPSVKKGKSFKLGKRERILSGELSKDALSSYDGYGQYYGGTQAYIENSGTNNGKTCLVVGDSFTHCLKRIIADNYKTTIVILPGNNEITLSLDSILEDYPIDDVIILTQATKYNLVGSCSPKFVGLK